MTTRPSGSAGSTSSTINSPTIQAERAFAAEVKAGGFSDILLLGMGGSSLCPEVLALTSPQAPGFPRLHILDSTDPAQIRSVESEIDLAQDSLHRFQQIRQHARAQHLQAVFLRARETDSSARQGRQPLHRHHRSRLEDAAESPSATASATSSYGLPSIGGRYSALSNFGMVPAAAMGIDTGKFLDRTKEMVDACAAAVPVAQNPGVDARHHPRHGRHAGPRQDHAHHLARHSRSRRVARTTDRRIHRQDRQGHHPGRSRGARRARCLRQRPHLRLRSPGLRLRLRAGRQSRSARKSRPARGSHRVADIYNLGQEFFRWEIATAVAGSIIGINAFNQPDVEASKIETREVDNRV